ncbi:MAG: hypothetical protein K0S62_2633 [Kosakonia cowanii]|nr:hypothetical protein [Kosakonia cowanii]
MSRYVPPFTITAAILNQVVEIAELRYVPPFTITAAILNQVVEIAELIEGLNPSFTLSDNLSEEMS